MKLPSDCQIDKETYEKAAKLVHKYRTKMGVIRRELWKLRHEASTLRPVLYTFGRRVQGLGAGTAIISHEPRQSFIKACPAEECKGFLSTAWKCGLCELWSCPECHELKGATRDAEHACDKDKVLTVQLLQKEAKSCPKCGVQICKIEGCDQMWCTSCNTGFNWRTGKIAQGPVHNPHYFEYLRKQGLNPATPLPQNAGNCNFETDRNITRALDITTEDDRYLLEAWRVMRENDQYRQNEENENEEKFRQLRVRFMAGEIQESYWKNSLQRLEKNMHFQRANNNIKDVFVNATRDLIRQIMVPGQDRAVVKKQVQELLEYCNTSADLVSKRFQRRAQKYVLRLV
jgi:hypothetical protein